MLPRRQREISVCQQTGALLLKHILVKWRKKKQSLQELLLSLLMPLILYMDIISAWYRGYPELPSVYLGPVNSFNTSTYAVQYTPVTQTTRQIMQHMASVSFLKDIVGNNAGEQTELESTAMTFHDVIEVNFNDAFSYELASHAYSSFHLQRDNMDHHSDSCSGYIFDEDVACPVSQQWTSGFVPLQANIDAAIIQVASNHSVMEELQSVTAEQMRLPPFRVVRGINYDFFLVCCAVALSPLIYFMSLNVAKDRRKFKELMKMMALQDFAFWCVKCPLNYVWQINPLVNEYLTDAARCLK